MKASPMCRPETEVVPVSTPIAARATIPLARLRWALRAKLRLAGWREARPFAASVRARHANLRSHMRPSRWVRSTSRYRDRQCSPITPPADRHIAGLIGRTTVGLATSPASRWIPMSRRRACGDSWSAFRRRWWTWWSGA